MVDEKKYRKSAVANAQRDSISKILSMMVDAECLTPYLLGAVSLFLTRSSRALQIKFD